MRKQAQYMGVKGMNQDLSISKYSPDFTFLNYNIRINSDNESTLFTINNSRGNSKIKLVDINNLEVPIHGTVIGYSIVHDYLVLFTTTRDITTILSDISQAPNGTDRIYRLEEHSEGLLVTNLYTGNLNFAKSSLIETIGVYESEHIIKVYWTDRNNQPRFINIVSSDTSNPNLFNFTPELSLQETHVLSKSNSGGSFHSGVIQYAFTYWNLNGAESNIFLMTELQTISDDDKAGSPEEVHSCSFSVALTNLDLQFEYLRMYAIERTSLNGEPRVRKVKDVDIQDLGSSSVTIYDDGIIGELFPIESLMFIGGEELVVGTIDTKDNVLFAGDLSIKRPSLENFNLTNRTITWSYATKTIDSYVPSSGQSGLYPYKPYTLNSEPIRHWKKDETYRFGLRAQYKTGIWSEVIFIEDSAPTLTYKTEVFDSSNNWLNGMKVSYVKGSYIIHGNDITWLLENGYKKIQLVYVPIEAKDREILGQGFLTGTVAHVGNRMGNSPFAYPDYLARPDRSLQSSSSIIYENEFNKATPIEWEHFRPLSFLTNPEHYTIPGYSEIESSSPLPQTTRFNQYIDRITYNESSQINMRNYNDLWFIDNNLVNFWSPDLEYGNLRHNLGADIQLKFRGIANASSVSLQNKYLFDEGGNNAWSHGKVNYSTDVTQAGVNQMLEVYNAKNKLEEVPYLSTIWNSSHLPQKWISIGVPINNRYSKEVISKVSTRFLYFGFNDMIINNDSTTFKDIYKPKVIDKESSIESYSTNPQDGNSGSIIYNNRVDEAYLINEKQGTVNINYRANTHLLFSFKNNKAIPKLFAGNSFDIKSFFGVPYYRQKAQGNKSGFSIDSLDNSIIFGMSDSQMKNRKSYESSLDGYAYLWLVDLVRNVSSNIKYGGTSQEAISNNVWIPASKAIDIRINSELIADQGDTYIQRYDVLRVSSNTSEVHKYSEVVSVLLESYVNIDGRYDTKRGSAGIENYVVENYAHVNPVYSQKDNVFPSSALDYKKFKNDKLVSSFLVSQPKKYNEFIDKWTNLWLNNAYEADGVLGKINKLVNYNNEIFGFQNKGIFQVLYNSRVQIPVSDGVPIEIAQSMKTDGVRYLTTNIGASNKWAIKKSNKGLYFIDSVNRDLYTLGDPPQNISETLGFKSWANNTFTNIGEYNLLNNKDAFIINVDYTNDDLFLNNQHYSLNMSERLSAFESFHSHENIPWMFNFKDNFISINYDSDYSYLWKNNQDDKYNHFYGRKRPSHIEFHINPDSNMDKVFDNFEYRSDIIDKNGVYLATTTFTNVTVWNEYQYGTSVLNKPISNFANKKFRSWSFPFPRHKGTLNRIRNPWVKLRLTFDNPANHKMSLHDLIITYTV